MARPSQNIDQTLLLSGRALLPECGCIDMSLRTLTEHAKVNMGMFHYHFKTKNNFLTILLQGMYEELFEQLQTQAHQEGSALTRLKNTVYLLANLLREHGAWLSRVFADAGRGDIVAQDFLRKNGTRHIQLIVSLIMEAKVQKEIADIAPMQAATFLMGSVIAPMLMAPRMMQYGFLPPPLEEQIQQNVLSEAGISERLERALYALTVSTEELQHVHH